MLLNEFHVFSVIFWSDFQVVSLSHLASVLGLDAVSAKAACETRGWAWNLELQRDLGGFYV